MSYVSPAHAAAARSNGAQSQGPVTAEGKARSAANSLKFGLYSSKTVLTTESQEIYDILRARYLDLFQPADIFEEQTVTTMVTTRWYIRRLETIHTCQFNLAIQSVREHYGPNAAISNDMLTTLAFNKLTDTNEAVAATRELDRLQRLLDRSYRQLLKHRSGKAPRAAAAPSTQHLESDIPANSTTQNRENEPKPAATAAPKSKNEPTTPPSPPLPFKPQPPATQPLPPTRAGATLSTL